MIVEDDAGCIGIGLVSGSTSVATEVTGTGLRIVVAAEGESGAVGEHTVLLAAGSWSEVQAAFKAGAYLPAHAIRAAGTDPLDGLVLRTGVEEVDEGFLWARSRLESALARAEHTDRLTPAERWWATIAALGASDPAIARSAVQALSPEASVEAVWGAARLAMVSGDTSPAVHIARSLFGAAASATLTDAFGEPRSAAAALRAFAIGVQGVVVEELVGRIQEAGKAAGAASTRAPGGKLPMVGDGGGAPRAEPWFEALFRGEPLVTPSPEPHAAGRSHLPGTFVTDPDGAWLTWRSALSEALDDGPAGAGSWDSPEDAGGPLVAGTASFISAIAYGLLGWAPDARVGRLTLAPRLPSHLSRFRIEGIAVGASRFALDYDRLGDAHRFVLEPTRGGTPPALVFAPAIAGQVRSVRIDGTDAELGLSRLGERTVVPVQLAGDGVRTIEITAG